MLEINNIYKGDCIELLKNCPKGRLLLTDIPYGEVSRTDGSLRNLDKGAADVIIFELPIFLDAVYNLADVIIIWCGIRQISEIFNYFNNKGTGTVRQLVWAKSNPSPLNGKYVYLSGTENAIWFKKKGTGALEDSGFCKKNWFQYPCGRKKYGHPTEKNLDLFKELVADCTKEGDLVIDPCAGSFTTCHAAAELGRNFIGMELNDEFYNIGLDRLKDYLKK